MYSCMFKRNSVIYSWLLQRRIDVSPAQPGWWPQCLRETGPGSADVSQCARDDDGISPGGPAELPGPEQSGGGSRQWLSGLP